MARYGTEFKLQVVESYLAGDGGAKLLARRWSVPEEKIRTWVNHYRLHGIGGLQPKRSRYSTRFKLQVLAHQERERLSNRQVAAIYDIRNCNQVAAWKREAAASQLTALGHGEQESPAMQQKRCRPAPSGAGASDPTHALREENERLRAEVAYLKKLHALIRARRSAARTRRASSSD